MNLHILHLKDTTSVATMSVYLSSLAADGRPYTTYESVPSELLLNYFGSLQLAIYPEHFDERSGYYLARTHAASTYAGKPLEISRDMARINRISTLPNYSFDMSGQPSDIVDHPEYSGTVSSLFAGRDGRLWAFLVRTLTASRSGRNWYYLGATLHELTRETFALGAPVWQEIFAPSVSGAVPLFGSSGDGDFAYCGVRIGTANAARIFDLTAPTPTATALALDSTEQAHLGHLRSNSLYMLKNNAVRVYALPSMAAREVTLPIISGAPTGVNDFSVSPDGRFLCRETTGGNYAGTYFSFYDLTSGSVANNFKIGPNIVNPTGRTAHFWGPPRRQRTSTQSDDTGGLWLSCARARALPTVSNPELPTIYPIGTMADNTVQDVCYLASGQASGAATLFRRMPDTLGLAFAQASLSQDACGRVWVMALMNARSPALHVQNGTLSGVTPAAGWHLDTSTILTSRRNPVISGQETGFFGSFRFEQGDPMNPIFPPEYFDATFCPLRGYGWGCVAAKRNAQGKVQLDFRAVSGDLKTRGEIVTVLVLDGERYGQAMIFQESRTGVLTASLGLESIYESTDMGRTWTKKTE